MFHTFQATTVPPRESSSDWSNNKGRRRISTAHACEECRRRKIRCDGQQPCGHCQWYKHPELCQYFKRQPRVVPSQKMLDELSSSLDQSRMILKRLFLDVNLKEISSLSRDNLIDLILSQKAQDSLSSDSPQTSPNLSKNESSRSEGSTTLDALEQEPSQGVNWDESRVDPNGIPIIPDDVNALSMSVRQQSSYVGVSSIAAALTVISKISSIAEPILTKSPNRTNLPTRSNSPIPKHGFYGEVPHGLISGPAVNGSVALVDAYFSQIHPFIPMIDEARFRTTFAANERRDPPWQALLNMVFAMGTIAASTCDNNSHIYYYKQAKAYLDLDTFGSGHIEALQALGLMGGFYLHYESRPNMASAIMGAAIRMASALGLHREYTGNAVTRQLSTAPRAKQPIPVEVRRRTWWSLFVLDTWASTTLSRPSLGRTGPGVTVQPPSYASASMDDPENLYTMILRHEIAFCKIATRIQDRLSETPLLPFDELSKFDSELTTWASNLPPLLQPSETCPERVRTPRAVMAWRYSNLRFLLRRPVLLNNALRSNMSPSSTPTPPSEEETNVVSECRSIARSAISDIGALWVPCQMSGWNAVWLLFQASMVPLVTIFAELNRANEEEVQKAIKDSERVVELLDAMSEWSIAAKRSRDNVTRILEMGKYSVMHAHSIPSSQSSSTSSLLIPSAPVVPSTMFAATATTFQPSSQFEPLSLGPPFSSEQEVSTIFDQIMWGMQSFPEYLDVSFDGEMGDVVPMDGMMIGGLESTGPAGYGEDQGGGTSSGMFGMG